MSSIPDSNGMGSVPGPMSPAPEVTPPAPGAMPPAPGASPDEPRGVLSLIRDLQAGRLTGSALATADRRRVVEQLALEGYSVAEIAEILKVSDRTIARDRAAMKASHALDPNADLVRETIGALVRHAETGIGRLRRIGRDREVSAAVRVQAETAAWVIVKEAVSLLQSVGYIPTAATRIQATLDARFESDRAPSCDELQKEIDRLERILGEGAHDSPEFQSLVALRDSVTRLAIGRQLQGMGPAAREVIDQPATPPLPPGQDGPGPQETP